MDSACAHLLAIEGALGDAWFSLFVAFMEHLPGLAFIKDTGGRYLYANDNFARLVKGAFYSP